ncbi:hypothetical protein [Lacunimicrobium album]
MQPEFQALFFDWGENVARPLQYAVRHDSNLRHDIAFLSSLLHDAEILKVTHEAEKVVCDLLRDTWELYRKNQDVRSFHCTLLISPFANEIQLLPGQTIEHLSSFRSSIEPELVFIRFHFSNGDDCDVRLPEFEFEIKLLDLQSA